MLCFVFIVQRGRASSFPVATILFIFCCLFCMETVCLMYPFSDPHVTFCKHSYLVSLSWTVCTSSLKIKQDLHWYFLWPLAVKWVVWMYCNNIQYFIFAPHRNIKKLSVFSWQQHPNCWQHKILSIIQANSLRCLSRCHLMILQINTSALSQVRLGHHFHSSA